MNFGLFWEKVELMRVQWDVEEPQLPRKRKVPRRYEQGAGKAEFQATAKDLYRQVYFEAIDLAVTSINDRFDQPVYKVYSNVEQLLFKACSGVDYEDKVKFVCEFYGEDVNRQDLDSQLKVLRTLYIEKTDDGEKPSIQVLKRILQSLTPTQLHLVDMVCWTFQLLIIMPATNAMSERSFSALRRIKT